MNRAEELRDKHDRCGEKSLAENMMKRITMKCLHSIVIKPIAIALDEAKTFREDRRLIIIHMHNVVTGMMDGDMQQPFYSMNVEQFAEEIASRQEEIQKETAGQDTAVGGDLNVAAEGKSKSKCKRNGQCWHCWEWGHPRRECLQLNNQKGDVNALKGKGKGNGLGYKGGYKGGTGKGPNGSKGKGYKGYRSFGKAIGKGFNYHPNEDYAEAWKTNAVMDIMIMSTILEIMDTLDTSQCYGRSKVGVAEMDTKRSRTRRRARTKRRRRKVASGELREQFQKQCS